MGSEGRAFPLCNLTHSRFRAAGLVVAIAIAYFLAARLGLALRAQVGVAIFWPAAGIAAGALIALGPAARLPVAIGIAVASIASSFTVDMDPRLAATFVVLGVGEVLLTAWLVEYWFGALFKIEGLPQVLGFLVACAIAAATTAAAAAFAISSVDPFTTWRLWFASCSLGLITVAPLLIGVGDALREPPPRRELIEGAIALTILAALGTFVLSLPPGPWTTGLPVAFAFLLLLWVAVRCRPVFAAAAMFVVTLTVVWSTIFDMGHFGDANVPLADRILAAQTLVLAGTLLALVLAALFFERRRSEAALKASKKRLELALDGAELGTFSADLTTGRLECDARTAQIHGHNASPQTIKEIRRFIPPDDRARIDAALAEAKRSGRRWNVEYRVLPPPNHPHAGETRWVAFESSVVRTHKGTPVGLLGVTRDITQRKRAEQALADQNVQATLAGRASLVGTYTSDTNEEKAQISPGYAAIHGLPEGTTEITRNEWLARVHPEDVGRLQMLRQQTFHQRLREYKVDYRIIRDGEVRWIESRTFISYNSDGLPERVIGANIDITERRRAEEHQRVLVAELDHRVKNVLATVSAVVSHTRQGSGSVDDFAAAIDGRIRSMATTHELLSSGRWQGISLAELIRCELAPYVTGSNVKINGPQVLLKSEAAQATAMVLHELATNAAKYGALSTKRGRVSIRWDRRLNGHPRSHLVLEWRELGGPPVVVPSKPSYGTSTIRDLIPYEFGGSVELVLAPEGVRCRLELSSDWLSDDAAPVSPADTAETVQYPTDQ
jgi:PAS domain S-box-containing protein